MDKFYLQKKIKSEKNISWKHAVALKNKIVTSEKFSSHCLLFYTLILDVVLCSFVNKLTGIL